MGKTLDFVKNAPEKWVPLKISYGPDIDSVLMEMSGLIEEHKLMADKYPARWLALKYLEGDPQIRKLTDNEGSIGHELSGMAKKLEEHCIKTLDTTPEAIIADYRYGYIASVVKQGVVTITRPQERLAISDRIDRVLTHRFLGPALMIGVLYAMFIVTFSIGEIPMKWLEIFFSWLSDQAVCLIPPGIIRSMVVDGIIAGVGGVLGFVPLIMIMFCGIAFLEDSGYMARMAYMMDRVLRIFGLHGCSVMPFIVRRNPPADARPGIMAQEP